jgi:hypothetical protein
MHTAVEKIAIVEEASQPGATVSTVAHKDGVNANPVFSIFYGGLETNALKGLQARGDIQSSCSCNMAQRPHRRLHGRKYKTNARLRRPGRIAVAWKSRVGTGSATTDTSSERLPSFERSCNQEPHKVPRTGVSRIHWFVKLKDIENFADLEKIEATLKGILSS